MSQLEGVFDPFADAVEEQLVRMAAQIVELRTLVEELQVQVRNAPAGPAGPPGPQGERGADAISVPGPVGPQGPSGESVVGPQGATGERGADGIAIPGPVGPAGPMGERGADGIATREEIESIVETRAAEIRTRNMADWDRGVYVAGTQYERGAVVTWDGQTYLAKSDTSAQPGTVPEWRRLASKGRDGRDARK